MIYCNVCGSPRGFDTLAVPCLTCQARNLPRLDDLLRRQPQAEEDLLEILGAAMHYHLSRVEHSSSESEAMETAMSSDEVAPHDRRSHAKEFLKNWRARGRT